MPNSAASDKFKDRIAACVVADNAKDQQGQLKTYSALRDEFFSVISFAGVSIDVYDRTETLQSDRFAMTHGGLITLQCDAVCKVGDIIIADMPHIRNQDLKMNGGDGPRNLPTPHGLPYVSRTGNKLTLAVVPMPSFPASSSVTPNQWRIFRSGFFARGQVIGRCTKENSRGKGTIDVVMGTFVGGSI